MDGHTCTEGEHGKDSEKDKLVEGKTEDSMKEAKVPTENDETGDSEKNPLLQMSSVVKAATSNTDDGSSSSSATAPGKAQKSDLRLEIPVNMLVKSQNSGSGKLTVAVFIKDRKLGDKTKHDKEDKGNHRKLELEKGKSTNAGEIKEKMLINLSIPKTSSHLFAIWLISPHLELQLKPHHVPFTLRKQWPVLLKKFSDCVSGEEMLDEPVLVFQRNSFITIAEEKKETDHIVLKRLFEEASYNVLKARYPVTPEMAENLGGILLRLDEGEFSPEEHRAGVFKKRLSEFLPYYAIGYNKISQYIHSSSTEQRLLRQYEEASKNLQDNLACYKEFLKKCYELEFYGCAFFKGFIFQECADYKIWKSEKKLISIGLNRQGITIFKGETEENLAHFNFGEISWDHQEKDENNEVERFVIEYDVDDSESIRQIQIMTKQASLMDAMVESCSKFPDLEPEKKSKISHKKLLDISYIVPKEPEESSIPADAQV